MREGGGNETEENKFREREWNNLKGRRKCKEEVGKERGWQRRKGDKVRKGNREGMRSWNEMGMRESNHGEN